MIPGMEPTPTATVTVQLRKVLVVDEALPIRRKLLDILHRAGVRTQDVLHASGADEALEIFVREQPTLVLCELVGEPEQGLEMVLEMLQVNPHAKIVLVTAEDASGALVRQAVRAGVFGVVRKPLRHEAIRQMIGEIEAEEGGIERFR